MTASEITAAIPHRPPMLLVDSVVEQNEQTIHCQKTFHADEYFFQGHYPDEPIVPGVILCECAAQCGAILLSSRVGDQPGVPVLTRMNDVKFKQIVRPGDTIDMNVTLDDVVSNAFFLTGKVSVAGKLAVRFNFACTLAPPQRKSE